VARAVPALSLVGLLFVGCAAKPVARQPLVVQTETIDEASFSPSIEVISQLSPTTDVALSPEVEGRVVKILATQGPRVRAGQPILVLDNVQQSASLDASIAEAAIAAAESRMRPILMMAIASLAGFLPLVVATTAGANSQQSLGSVIFGGLLVATVLSLGLVPPFYVVIKNLEARWFPEAMQETPA